MSVSPSYQTLFFLHCHLSVFLSPCPFLYIYISPLICRFFHPLNLVLSLRSTLSFLFLYFSLSICSFLTSSSPSACPPSQPLSSRSLSFQQGVAGDTFHYLPALPGAAAATLGLKRRGDGPFPHRLCGTLFSPLCSSSLNDNGA